MKSPKALDYKCLRQKLSFSQLDFETTQEIKSLTEFVGQKRALDALTFGIGIKSQGYNLYAMGPSGVGKLSLVSSVLSDYAKKSAVPNDWCYIHNFETPEQPIAISLPAGQGHFFQQDIKFLIEELQSGIRLVFESHEYRIALKKIQRHFETRRKQNEINKATDGDKISQIYQQQHEKEKALQKKLIIAIIKPIVSQFKKKYKKFPDVVNYLSAILDDIIEHINSFIKQNKKTDRITFSLENPALTRYKVNLLIDNSKLQGAPVLFEEAPTYSTLICRVEHTTEQGSLVTNFSLIKPGALHRANGGYLIIESRKFKKNQEAWEALKSALYSQEINIKPIEHPGDSIKPVSLEPMAIPLDIKIILLGDRSLYYCLCQDDPDFTELFKVAVDFDEQIIRNKKNIQLYARLIGTIIKRKRLRPFHASAVSAVIDYSSRLAEDIEKLSTHIRNIEDLILESDYWASITHKKIVKAADVKQAIAAQIHRADRSKELYYEDINRNFIIINTLGKSIGQVNCLSVRRAGDFSYGHPTRVTARVRTGKGKIIDIQREIKLAGPFHSKAGLIIANFLGGRFSQDKPLSLFASLSFEQIYSWTDGDSASVGELCALLSALAEVPVYQFLAVTGSIDQYGNVQAVGGVNEKIEGFFDVCKSKKLNGKQGVLIPAINQKNLMLREDVVKAAKNKEFFIYTIETIDEAILLLTGLKAGKRNAQGNFPENTLYYKVEKRLQKFASSKNSR